ncbi:SGNH/GDSL hydrolase family protein [Streptomyces corynorhini]|uniref:SGNH/GDSL hydrolase family protein n=1 Tax=Streptomyces corynorhini TaxID=2282652 RepID=A0A370BE86_9ACTN|nr:SGNH/GDSL hydrolase family protein [Streptomyces corynorhini]RDG40010.1 SGNH/GDSL hydrolase family protein [Streptomyces corynorhini]
MTRTALPRHRARRAATVLTLTATALTAVPAASSARPAPASEVVTWAASADRLGEAVPGRTHRVVIHTSAGGRDLRVRLSNAFGEAPVTFGRAYAGPRAAGAAVQPGHNRPLTFRGAASVTVPPGGSVYSDPLPGTVRPGADLAVSVYVQDAAGTATGHVRGNQTSYIAPSGDHAVEESDAAYTERTTFRHYLDAVVVRAPAGTGAVVAFGDSITDGSGSTPDTDRRWPDFLAARLRDDRATSLKGVANAGISGNKVLGDGAGVSALKRLDRDVLSQRGLRTVILLEGVNDIKAVPAPTAAELIDGYRQIIARTHAAGACVVGATVMPYEGWGEWKEAGEAVRQEVNAFIRDSGAFDAVVDFDALVRDPAAPAKMLPVYDSGDHLHPNDAGMEAMGEHVEPRALRCSR